MQKKASGTATPGKSPLLPIFERGSSQCRAQHSWTANMNVRARSCSLFSSFKKGKAFSLRCLSPLCSPAVGVGQAYPLQVGRFSCGLGIFATQKASRVFKPCWSQIAEKTPCFFSKTRRFLNSKNKLTRKERLGDLFHVLHGSSKEGLCAGTAQAVKVFASQRSVQLSANTTQFCG